MWAPVCQVGTWQGMFGEVEITHEIIDKWVSAFGPDEKIPVTIGHLSDPKNVITTGDPAPCWISGLMKAGEILLGNYVDWTPAGLEAVTSGGYKNVSIESLDGSRLDSVALLGSRTPAVEFHSDRGRFVPLDMAGPCLGEGAQILLAQAFGEPIALPYKSPPKKITDLFDDEAGSDAWTKAFNAAFEQYDGDEAKANATAWAQIKKMGYEKGKDGKYRKPKKAATAAKETKMGIKEKVKEALSALLAKLDEEGDETPVTAAPPETTVEPVVAPGVSESPQFAALAAQVEALKTRVTESEQKVIAVTAKGQALAFRNEAHLPPALDVALEDWCAGKSEVRMDEEGTKKLPQAEFVKRLVMARGTQKLTAAVVFGNPPAKTKVEALSVEPEGPGLPTDQETLVMLAENAKVRAREKGITLAAAQIEVNAEWRKDKEA
ncbi:MAG TPA: ChaB family protein [bacterium]|nr:ChaB family protein [bacterium]